MTERGPEQPHTPLEQLGLNHPGFGDIGEENLGGQAEADTDRLIEFLRREYKNAFLDVLLEVQLEKVRLLSVLESAGILPVVKNPNPFELELEEEQHEQWWKEHPAEEEEFSRNVENRDKILRYLYIGMTLGHLFPELFPNRQS
jgi:hypothetical protein